MSIDRIGKGVGGAAPLPGAQDAGKAEGASRAFEVRGDSATTKEVEGAKGTAATPLEKLRAGEIDVHGYIDLQVNDATAHLNGLDPSELESIKQLLRDELAGDPGLADLVRRATGHLPTPPEE
ncbi:MAG: hypothetical protein ABI183_25895 [Polyangiaceae bacterium]